MLRARVDDPDGPVRAHWRWYNSSDKDIWTPISGAGAFDYTPGEDDRGMYLRAVGTYTEGGVSKTLEAITSSVVEPAESVLELEVTDYVTGLTIPWDLAFAPDGTMLFTERGGALKARLTSGTVQTVTADMRDLFVVRKAGLMSIVLDPGFSSNRRFYTCQTHTGPEVQVISWTIDANYTTATRADDPLIGGIPAHNNGAHVGCRLRFGPQGYLWIATGDALQGPTAPHDLTSLGGKVLRVNASTGAGAPGNPFSNPDSPLIYTYGHRNPQGLARRPGAGQMWLVDHGPRWDDEINLLTSGGNYGWNPQNLEDEAQYSEEVPMTDLQRFPDAIEAKWSSGQDTIANSGGIFLEGNWWGGWEGRLAVASLKDSSLRLFEFTPAGDLMSETKVSELDGTHGRLRSPVLGPDKALYITTSNGGVSDKILKVTPKSTPLPPPKRSTKSTSSSRSGGGGSSRAPSPPSPPPRSPIIGSTEAATAKELAGDLLVLQRHDQPGVEVEVGVGWISRDGERIIVIGFVRDGDLGQTYAVVRREGDGQVVRRWIAPDSHLIYGVPWAVVNAQYTFPVGVISAIPLDDQYPSPNMLMRRFDGGDDRILAYDAGLGQWRHVPDEPTFQARGYYWCNVTAADAGFFDRITLGPPYPASNVPARDDYPVCQA